MPKRRRGAARFGVPFAGVLVCVACAVLLSACGESPKTATVSVHSGGTDGTNSEWGRQRPYLVLVSIDGFRFDYFERHSAPALERLAASGVRARALRPAYPTLTFPNHYSIATGLWPARHGIVANTFPGDAGEWYAYKDRTSVQDGRWYGGEPIWVAAERHGMVSAAYFFVGTEAAVGGVAPTHWHAFDRKVPGETRVDQALAWLAEPAATRPHVVTLYFEEVDETAHRYGPESPETAAAIASVDRHVDRLVAGIGSLAIAEEITLVIVSDHGQASYLPDAPALVLDEVVDLTGFDVVDGGSYAFLFAKDVPPSKLIEVRDAINGAWRHGRAWLREEAPAEWSVMAESRFPEIIVQADLGHGVIATQDREYIMTPGDHGWAPEAPEMHGIFIAAGPRLPQGRLIDPVRVVDLYPLMREILNLPPANVDGDPEVLLPLLEPREST